MIRVIEGVGAYLGLWHSVVVRQPMVVSDEEREVLERWSKRPKSPHSVAQRARIRVVVG